MKSLFDFLIESAPKTDNSIYYKIGQHKFNWKSGSQKERIISKYDIRGEHKRQGIISYAKDVMVPILDDSEEIIHRKDWDLDSLIGETELQLMHPAYWTMTEYILKNHKKKHDILTLFECSNVKPYSSNPVIKNNFLDKYSLFSDFASISNPGIIPMEYSHYYPYRYDEWDHFAEKEDIANKYVFINASRFIHYVKTLGYKHVIVVMQHSAPQKALDYLKSKNPDNCSSWLHIVTDDDFRESLKRKYGSKFGSQGLLITRTLSLPYTREQYEKTLSRYLDSKDKDKFNELMDILSEKSRSTRKTKLKEYKEKYDIEPIDNETGTGDSFKQMSSNDTKTEYVNKYKSFINSFIEKSDDRISKAKEDKKYHEHKIYFTVLDMLMEYHDGATLIDEPDTRYWSMKKAIDDTKEFVNIYNYVYYKKDDLKTLGIQESDIIKESDKLGVTQTNDDRKKKQKK